MNRNRFVVCTLVAGWLILGTVAVSVPAQQTTPSPAQQTTPPPTPAAAAAALAAMPDGQGKVLTGKLCTKCHGVERITSQHKDADGWTAVITQMVGFGAVGTDDEFGTILDYLTKNYGVDSSAAPAKAPGSK